MGTRASRCVSSFRKVRFRSGPPVLQKNMTKAVYPLALFKDFVGSSDWAGEEKDDERALSIWCSQGT